MDNEVLSIIKSVVDTAVFTGFNNESEKMLTDMSNKLHQYYGEPIKVNLSFTAATMAVTVDILRGDIRESIDITQWLI